MKVKFTSETVPDDCYTVSCSGEGGAIRAFFLEGQWYDADAEPGVRKIKQPWFWNHIGQMA